MWLAKLLYAALAAVALLFSILYLPEFSVCLLMTVLLIPICLFGLSWWEKRHLHLTLDAAPAPIPPNTTLLCTVHLHNRSRLPISMISIQIRVTHTITKETIFLEQQVNLSGKGHVRLLFSAKPEHCGHLTFHLSRVRIFDWLRLFSRRLAVDCVRDAVILPQIPVLPVPDLPQKPMEGEKVLIKTPEPEEFLGVREYRDGDRMRSIHWKLSSKFDDPVVREYGKSIVPPVTIAMVYALDSQTQDFAAQVDAMFEAITTLTSVLCQIGKTIHLTFFSEQGTMQFTLHLAKELTAPLCELSASLPSDTLTQCRDHAQQTMPDYCIVQENHCMMLLVRHSNGKATHLPLVSGSTIKSILHLFDNEIPQGGAS